MAIQITAELEELKAQAEGRAPFTPNGLFEKLGELVGGPQYKSMTPAERLALGYYLCARRRARMLKEGE